MRTSPGIVKQAQRLEHVGVFIFQQLRDIGKASAFLKAYEKIVAIDAWAQKKREQFVAIGYH